MVPGVEAVAFSVCAQVVPAGVLDGVLTPRRFGHTRYIYSVSPQP